MTSLGASKPPTHHPSVILPNDLQSAQSMTATVRTQYGTNGFNKSLVSHGRFQDCLLLIDVFPLRVLSVRRPRCFGVCVPC